MQIRVALLEDEPSQAEVVKIWLAEYDYFCHHFSRSEALLKNIVNESYDIFLIDWELPDLNGNEVVKRLRNEYHITSPIIFTTSRDSEKDIVEGLEAGADDYLTKPLRKFELNARINALLRRVEKNNAPQTAFSYPPYEFNRENESVLLNGEPIALTSKEFQVAAFLFNNAGKILSRGHILERVWGQRSDLNTRTVDTHVSTVRQKLNIRPNTGWKLSSIYRHGYRLEKVTIEESA